VTAKRILIIEDNVLSLELAADLLEANGFIISSAHTGEEGLRLAQEISPDLVLMDLGLPGMDGLSATQKFKANPATRHLPVVGLTARAMEGDEQIALNAGCAGYLTKPIDTRTFIGCITHFIASANSCQTTKQSPEKNYDS
jgi:CheY-like chemotaxis protein